MFMYKLYEKNVLELVDLKTIFLPLVGKKPSSNQLVQEHYSTRVCRVCNRVKSTLQYGVSCLVFFLYHSIVTNSDYDLFL
jgi:hypothetical protein